MPTAPPPDRARGVGTPADRKRYPIQDVLNVTGKTPIGFSSSSSSSSSSSLSSLDEDDDEDKDEDLGPRTGWRILPVLPNRRRATGAETRPLEAAPPSPWSVFANVVAVRQELDYDYDDEHESGPLVLVIVIVLGFSGRK